MAYATNADLPANVRTMFSDRCQTVWRNVWNGEFERDQNEKRAFAFADSAAQNCTAAGKSADEDRLAVKSATPQTADAMRQHLEAAPPAGHACDCAGMAMPAMTAMHDALHTADAAHAHPMAKSSDILVERAVKFVAPDTIEGLAMPFGMDTDGEAFTADTDFCIEWFGKSGRPFLFDHGLDATLKGSVVGRQSDFEIRDEGVWAQVQLDRNARYRKAINRLIDEEALGFSSGSMPHLTTKNRKGEITRWPWVELSGTPIPAHPGALNVHYVKSADFLSRLGEESVPAALVASALKALDDIPADEALLDGDSFADRLDRFVVDGPDWVKARQVWYAKSGRVLSAATRERLATHPTALRQLADDLDELLTSADTPKADAGKSALMAALLGVEVSRARGLLPSD
jgi:cation transport regulator ChaB